jgi:hypothetical protein
MAEPADILVLGTGTFAARILFDLAAVGTAPTRVVIAGRNADRLAWLRVAANARAAMFGRPASFSVRLADLRSEDAAAAVLSETRPKVVVQAASAQTSAVISMEGNAWTRLVAEGGLSATAVFQALLSARVARAVQMTHPQCRFINSSFPDVVNGMLAALGLPVLCGVGNIAILSNAFAGELGVREGGPVKVLAHYQNLGPWRRAAETRSGPAPRVWIDDREVEDVYARFSRVRLTPEPAIDISGGSGVPLMLALAAGEDWQGHAPGPAGLPGGYPVALRNGLLALDLPPGLGRDEAVRWNSRYEEENGLVVGPDGRIGYTGRLYEKLKEVSPDLAGGFHVSELETVFGAMEALRASLLAKP